MIAGVVLAAGQSTRMGASKVLLALDGEPLVRRMTRRALEAGLAPVITVVGRDAGAAAGAVADLPSVVAVNAAYADGMTTSIRCGLGHLPAEAEAAVIVFADQPLVTVDQLRRIRSAYETGRPPVVVSSYDGVLAPPTLYRRDLFPELAAARGDGCRKRVIRAHLETAAVLPFPASHLADVDSPEDYARLARGAS
ncbi:MAG TPA: nucleotidyltransferase family protein [Thermodesulfobacteriota bacterium]